MFSSFFFPLAASFFLFHRKVCVFQLTSFFFFRVGSRWTFYLVGCALSSFFFFSLEKKEESICWQLLRCVTRALEERSKRCVKRAWLCVLHVSGDKHALIHLFFFPPFFKQSCLFFPFFFLLDLFRGEIIEENRYLVFFLCVCMCSSSLLLYSSKSAWKRGAASVYAFLPHLLRIETFFSLRSVQFFLLLWVFSTKLLSIPDATW